MSAPTGSVSTSTSTSGRLASSTASASLTDVMSETHTSSHTSPSTSPTGGGVPGLTGNGNGMGNSTMYLFTFLATAVILATIALVLVFRAALARRRFRREIQEAIATGRALPQYQNPFYTPRFMPVRARESPLLPTVMPKLWEDEMRITDDREVGGVEEKWEWLTPISVTEIHAPTVPPPPPPAQPFPAIPTLGSELREAFRIMLPGRRRRQHRNQSHPPPPDPAGVLPEPVLMEAPTVADAPVPGADVRIGVLVAMPSDGPPERWAPLDPEEAEVPEVFIGVMQCTVGEERAEKDVWGGP